MSPELRPLINTIRELATAVEEERHEETNTLSHHNIEEVLTAQRPKKDEYKKFLQKLPEAKLKAIMMIVFCGANNDNQWRKTWGDLLSDQKTDMYAVKKIIEICSGTDEIDLGIQLLGDEDLEELLQFFRAEYP